MLPCFLHHHPLKLLNKSSASQSKTTKYFKSLQSRVKACPVAFSYRMTKSEYGKCKVLYNSQLLFQHRHYADLGTILYHVHLFQPLSQLMKHTALYVHNAVPREAFQALTRCAP